MEHNLSNLGMAIAGLLFLVVIAAAAYWLGKDGSKGKPIDFTELAGKFPPFDRYRVEGILRAEGRSIYLLVSVLGGARELYEIADDVKVANRDLLVVAPCFSVERETNGALTIVRRELDEPVRFDLPPFIDPYRSAGVGSF